MPRKRPAEDLLLEALATPMCSPCTSRVPPIIDGKEYVTELVMPLTLDCAICEREFSKKYPVSSRAGHTTQYVPMCKQHYDLWGVAEAVAGPQLCPHGVRIVAHPPIPARSSKQ